MIHYKLSKTSRFWYVNLLIITSTFCPLTIKIHLAPRELLAAQSYCIQGTYLQHGAYFFILASLNAQNTQL